MALVSFLFLILYHRIYKDLDPMFATTLPSGKIEKKKKEKRHTSEVGQYLRNMSHIIQCTVTILLPVRQIMDVFHSD